MSFDTKLAQSVLVIGPMFQVCTCGKKVVRIMSTDDQK